MTHNQAVALWRQDPTHFSPNNDENETLLFWRPNVTDDKTKLIAWFDYEEKPIYLVECLDNRLECLGWMRDRLNLGELNYPRAENEKTLVDRYIASLGEV